MSFHESNYNKFKAAVRLGPMSVSNSGDIGFQPNPMLDAGYSVSYGPFSVANSKMKGYSRDSLSGNFNLSNNSSTYVELSKDNFKNKGIQFGYRKDF